MLPSELVEFAIWVQDLLVLWVLGCLAVGVVLLLGGARAAGAALVGSSFCSFLAYPLKGLYGGDHLETLVHGGVILASVGLVGFGLAGLRRPPHAPLGRYPVALTLASGTVVVGTLLIRRIDALAVREFEDLGFRRYSRSTSPSSRCCSWCRRGGRRGHSGKQPRKQRIVSSTT